MRIGLLTDIYKPALNGITNFVSLHKRELERRGHEVWVFTPEYTGYQDDEPRVVRFKAIPLSDSGYRLGFGYDQNVRRFLAEMDILHAQTLFLSGIIATTLGQRFGIPVVFTNHTRYDLSVQQHVPRFLSPLADTLLETCFSTFTQHCDLVVAPTISIRNLMQAWGTKCRMEIVPNGIDLEACRNPRIRHGRAEVGVLEDDRVAVFVGRMSVEKNVPFLLHAFSLAIKEVSNAHLLLVGGGPELGSYRELASELGIDERVHFTGWVPYEEIPGYLLLADFFVTASVTEVHPLTVLEAVATGIPVLGIHSPGIADIVEHERNGILTAADAAIFALNMAHLFQDNALRAQLAEGANATGQRYSIVNTTQRYIELYQKLIDTKGNRRVKFMEVSSGEAVELKARAGQQRRC
jgi:glycosyltransferase involved in cell wall biosynthesis